MAQEYTEADVQSLLMLMELEHQFLKTPTTQLASEIRLQRQCFGLTPIDRRRLDWQLRREPTGEAGPATPPAPPPRQGDPRAALRAVT